MSDVSRLNKIQKKNIIVGIVVAVLVIFAAVSGKICSDPEINRVLGLIRGMIYISIMAAWGVSVHLRIVQKQVRQYLGAISFLIILWLTIRTVKYEFVENITAMRYLWYGYYFSMLFIPLFALFVSLSLGKSEDYRIPKWTRVFYIPAFLIFLMVFTNDLHQCVFVFTGGGEWSDRSYEYSFGIYIAVAWQVICAASAIVIMIIKCRIPQSKKFFGLPLVLLAAATVYTALYAIKLPWIIYVAGDFTVSLCLFTVGIFECCIQCRMIQSNTGYDSLFSITTIGAHITDEKLKIKYSSKTAVEPTGEIMAQAVNGSVMLDENTVLKSHKIHKGYVFWQEDVSELADITKKLEQTQEELRDTGDVLKAESEQKAHWLQIVEENRLYDMIENQTAPQIARLKDILEKLKKTDEFAEAQRLLAEIVVIGTYIKRRSNLIFVAGQKDSVAAEELLLCINETASNLKLYGVECNVLYRISGQLSPGAANLIYDFFEAVIEKSLNSLTDILLYAEEDGTALNINISAACDCDFAELDGRFTSFTAEHDEDGIWCLSLMLKKDGETI